MKIFPKPYQLNEKIGKFEFSKKVVLCIDEQYLDSEIIQLFSSLWKNFTCGVGDIVICAGPEQNKAFLSYDGSGINALKLENDAHYALTCTSDGVSIAFKDQKSMAYALIGMLSLIETLDTANGQEKFSIKYCEIVDKPSMEFRGIHLCVFPDTTLHWLEKMLSAIAFLKYSHIVLEFWGMIKLDALKELAWPHAFTKEQLKPIIEKVKAMGVEFIPMFNHLGHASGSRVIYGRHVVLDQKPELQPLFEPDGWTWNIKNQDTLKLLENIRVELCNFFGEGKYFHLGCDEAYSYGISSRFDGLDKTDEYISYMNVVVAHLKELKRRPIVWGDEWLDKQSWAVKNKKNSDAGSYIALGEKKSASRYLNEIDKDVIINDWQYEIINGTIETSLYFKEKGREVFVSPWSKHSNVYSAVKTVVENGLAGVILTTWDQLVDKNYMIIKCAELLWETNKDLDYFNAGVLSWSYFGSIARKLIPSNGNYDKSGWKKNECIT